MTANENQIQKQTNSNLSLSERLKANRVSSDACLLLDCSSSMNCEVEPGTSRMQALRNIVQSLIRQPKCIAFNDYCQPCTKNTIPNPGGGTHMARAFEYMKAEGITKAVMITDGEANDKTAALESVKGLLVQIMYVGSGQKPAFLDELARASGGYCTKQDLSKPKEIQNKIQLFIGPT
jgi:Mg-chelatase subunit ChlD